VVDAAVFEGHGVGGFESAAGAEVGRDSPLGWCGGVGVLVAVVAELRSGFLHSGGKCAASGRNDIIFFIAMTGGRCGEVGDDDVAGGVDGAFDGDAGWDAGLALILGA